MRYGLFTVAALLFIAAQANSQGLAGKKPKDAKDELPAIHVKEIAGKSFDQWAKEIESPDPTEREVAMKTILNFHPARAYRVLPVIFKQLEKKPAVDLSVRVNGMLVLGTVFRYKEKPDPEYVTRAVKIFQTAIKDKQAILKIRSMQALPFLGPRSREAIPEVVEAIGDRDTYETRQVAIETLAALVMFDQGRKGLGQYQTKAMTALIEKNGALDDSSYLVRHAALRTLVVMGHNAESWKSPIIGKINDLIKKEQKTGKTSVVIQAHVSVINLKRNAADAVIDPTTVKEHLVPIIEMLQHSDSTTRLNALQAIGAIGPSAKPTVLQPVLDVITRDTDDGISLNAISQLFFLEAHEALPPLKTYKQQLSKKLAVLEPEAKRLADMKDEVASKLTEGEKQKNLEFTQAYNRNVLFQNAAIEVIGQIEEFQKLKKKMKEAEKMEKKAT